MREWIEGLVGPEYAFPVIVGLLALVALFVILVLWRLLRGSSAGGTYVAGGRNRKPRLAVMDATAIDNYRRLVLVRRDDVEHLILIGGSADVVVESNIRLSGSAQRPVAVSEPFYDQPETDPEPVKVAPTPPPVARAAPPAPPVMRSAPPPTRPQSTRIEPRPNFPAPAPPRTAAAPPAAPAPSKQSIDSSFDDDLLRELEVELDTDVRSSKGQRPAPSLDDEMSKLLDEFSTTKR